MLPPTVSVLWLEGRRIRYDRRGRKKIDLWNLKRNRLVSIHVSLCASDGASERVGEGRKLEVVYRKIGKGDGVDRG